jgi:hypothetical protein
LDEKDKMIKVDRKLLKKLKEFKMIEWELSFDCVSIILCELSPNFDTLYSRLLYAIDIHFDKFKHSQTI